MTFAFVLGWVLFGITAFLFLAFIIGFVVFIKHFNVSKSMFNSLLGQVVNTSKVVQE